MNSKLLQGVSGYRTITESIRAEHIGQRPSVKPAFNSRDPIGQRPKMSLEMSSQTRAYRGLSQNDSDA
ncbi:hypothetical protein V6N13_047757 [Hibiscus sabdariffa]|uniref:Uncharacterized protein n=1 Tax=Hibiscus sabdariffa TaxID=183260 RepID=A0ABR2F583_9ROSI